MRASQKSKRDLVVFGGRKGVIRVWDTEERKEVWTQEAAANPDSKEEEIIG